MAYNVEEDVKNEKKHKTRNQSLSDFLDSLQREYVVANLRRKIYPKQKDKNFWERVMNNKKDKIDDIAKRNRIPTIFNEPMVKQHYESEVYPVDGGLPNFIYANEEQRENLEWKDRRFYYLANSEVRVKQNDGEVKIGKIVETDLKNKIALIELKDSEEKVQFDLDKVTRIL